MNPFLLLGLPEKLELDQDTLDERVRDLAKSAHPDLGGDGERFEEIRRAGELLKAPGSRLKVSIEISGGLSSERGVVPSALMDFFSPVAGVLEKVDAFVAERERALSSLGKAILDAKVPELKASLERMIEQLGEVEEAEVLKFAEFDRRGWAECFGEMEESYRALLFVGKWLAQLRVATGKIFEALLAG